VTQTSSDLIAGYARLAPVIPVITIEDPAQAVPLARTLVEAGLPVIEVTLRTERALAVIAAGTVLRPEQIAQVAEAGAKFIVTPGTSRRMAEALAAGAIPAMPGCATVSEALELAEHGFLTVKFFPAGQSGGAAWLKSIAAPVPHIKFCPTGGVDAKNAADYLAAPNVVCVGGSWVTPKDALAAGDWATIGRLAREAAALRT
jgi:2-dehydro-3-deoxyphosphogluconate aldolase/(4S)-4-hydroxy-2-oxoglutarate aldolase